MAGFEALAEVVDYFVVNVSSPNTPNLRQLQEKKPLLHLLQQEQERNLSRATPRPLLLKIAPDLTDSQLDDILEIARETQLSGLVAINTTISRVGLSADPEYVASLGAGGRCGPGPPRLCATCTENLTVPCPSSARVAFTQRPTRRKSWLPEPR